MSSIAKTGEFKGKEVKERVEYRGDLRIVGVIVNNLKDNKPLGFIIMTEKNKQVKPYTIEQTKILLSRFKFVNAELSKGAKDLASCDIVNTECSMDRLMKFNPRMQILTNNKITILGELTDADNSKCEGYRVLNSSGRVIDLSEDDVLKLCDKGYEIVNGKVSSRGDTKFISGIKTTFSKIEINKPKSFVATPKNDKKEWAYYAHAKKVEEWAVRVVLNGLYCLDRTVKTRDLFVGTYGGLSKTGQFHLYRELSILANEIIDKYDLTERDRKILEYYKSRLNEVEKVKTRQVKHILKDKYSQRYKTARMFELTDSETEIILGIAQFITYDFRLLEKTKSSFEYETRSIALSRVYNLGYTNFRYNKLMAEGHATDKLLDILEIRKSDKYKQMRAKHLGSRNKTNQIRMYSAAICNRTSFKNTVDAAELGFAVKDTDNRREFKTCYNDVIKLKYVGINMDKDMYDKYLSLSNSFGDICSVAHIENLLYKYKNNNWITSEGRKSDSIALKELKIRVETILAMIYIYNPQFAGEYLKDKLNTDPDIFSEMLPGADFTEAVNYKLNPRLSLYYESGFNAYYVEFDSVTKNPKYDNYMRYSKDYCNYYNKNNQEPVVVFRRTYSIQKSIKHSDFEELVATLGLVTSIYTEDIAEIIGLLRTM